MATLAGAVALQGPSARAADLGGDCCADLEERIAELEATTARKGNRKVRLRISGQISQGILAFDDGGETNVYQVGNSNSSDRFRFDGSGRINKDLRAGFYLEFSTGVASSAGVTQNSDDGGAGAPSVRQSLWYIDSKTLGAVSVGFGAPATDDILGNDLGGTTIAHSADTTLIGGNMFTRDARTGTLNSVAGGDTISLRWSRFIPQPDTPRGNIVRYDSPVIMGFAAAASWGEDDTWDVALRYAGQWNGFKLAFGAGFYENNEEDEDTFGWPRGGDTEPNGGDTIIREIKGSASLIHEPSGLFASGAYLRRTFEGSDPGVQTAACLSAVLQANTGIGCTNRPDLDYYWLSAGVRLQNPFGIGPLSLYGEYARSEDGITGLNVNVESASNGDIDLVTSSTLEIWGVGAVQAIPSAGLDLFVSYRNMSADVSGREFSGPQVKAPIEDVDLFMAGSRIRF